MTHQQTLVFFMTLNTVTYEHVFLFQITYLDRNDRWSYSIQVRSDRIHKRVLSVMHFWQHEVILRGFSSFQVLRLY